MISVRDARSTILARVEALGSESVEVAEGLGRTLSDSIIARMPHPPFAQSAMDGFAVRCIDVPPERVTQGVRLPVFSESKAGQAPPPLPPGHAMRIFTGAPIPEGADAVVVQEDTRREGDDVVIGFAPTIGHHIRPAGASSPKGRTLARAGMLIDAAIVAALASEGRTRVNVRRKPRVAILSTGDELRAGGEALDAAAIYNSNAPMLRALVEDAGGESILLPAAPDALEALRASIAEGLSADVLLTTGGVSVGDYDLVRTAMQEAGVELSLWKVALKPGKPLTYGRRGETHVLGLPGNPVSAFVTFHLFVRPLLCALLGAPPPQRVRVRLETDYSHSTGREEYIRCELRWVDGELVAKPHPLQRSGQLHDLAFSDALVRVPAELPSMGEGSIAEALILRLPGS